jgi:SAM-dependent methyltransferase
MADIYFDADDESFLLRRLRNCPEIFAAIDASSPAELISQRKLRGTYDEDLVRAALSVHEARQRAAGMLRSAEQLWLTRVGLEQCTAPEVAAHKAKRFSGEPRVYDLCCGVGVDAAAIAEFAKVIAIDNAAAMCLRTEWNAAVWNRAENIDTQCADVTSRDWSGEVVHVDPDRRAGSDRPTKRLELYQPDLAWMQQLTRTAAGGCIKISPASNFLQKFPGCEIELISLKGECREATVWFGSLAGPHAFRATALPSGDSISADPLSVWTNVVPSPAEYIFDPDPAIVRSGLLDVVAEQQNMQRLDAEEEYLTGAIRGSSAFVTAFRIEAVLSGNLKELKKYLRKDPSTHYEIKCRRIPTNADAIRRQLPAGTARPRVIFFCRVSGRMTIVVASRL